MQLEMPLPGRPRIVAPTSDSLRAENDALRAMGAWAATVQQGG